MTSVVVGAVLVGLFWTPVWAITFAVSDVTGRSAEADFVQSGKFLSVSLRNTGTGAVGSSADVLTALFFSMAGDPQLTRVAAMVKPGSTVLNCDASTNCSRPVASNVGGEWGYRDDIAGLAPRGAAEGLSSVGFEIFRPADRFSSFELQGASTGQLEGINFGLATKAGIAGGPSDLGRNALVSNSVVFTLSGLPENYDLASAITNVSFQYGFSLSSANLQPGQSGQPPQPSQPQPSQPEPSQPPLQHSPEPTSLLLFGTSLVGLGVAARRKARAKRLLGSQALQEGA
jgi:hypothetical protein